MFDWEIWCSAVAVTVFYTWNKPAYYETSSILYALIQSRSMKTFSLIIYTDGASRGNPGPAAAGAVIKDERGHNLTKISCYLDIATNNQAEYRALIAGLEAAVTYNPSSIRVYMDSELIVRQLQGKYRVKNPMLKPLFQQACQLASLCGDVSFYHIPGTSNHEAHQLAEAAFKKKPEEKH